MLYTVPVVSFTPLKSGSVCRTDYDLARCPFSYSTQACKRKLPSPVCRTYSTKITRVFHGNLSLQRISSFYIINDLPSNCNLFLHFSPLFGVEIFQIDALCFVQVDQSPPKMKKNRKKRKNILISSVVYSSTVQ